MPDELLLVLNTLLVTKLLKILLLSAEGIHGSKELLVNLATEKKAGVILLFFSN